MYGCNEFKIDYYSVINFEISISLIASQGASCNQRTYLNSGTHVNQRAIFDFYLQSVFLLIT